LDEIPFFIQSDAKVQFNGQRAKAKVWRWEFGVQRKFPSQIAINASYESLSYPGTLIFLSFIKKG
jgi:hypothetical protein